MGHFGTQRHLADPHGTPRNPAARRQEDIMPENPPIFRGFCTFDPLVFHFPLPHRPTFRWFRNAR